MTKCTDFYIMSNEILVYLTLLYVHQIKKKTMHLILFYSTAQKISNNDTFEYVEKRTLIAYRAGIDIKVLSNDQLMVNGTWNRQTGIQALPNRTIQAARRYFRIGTAEASVSYRISI